MPFITRNNFDSIVHKLTKSDLDPAYIATLGKPWFSNLYNLSLKEHRRLLLYKGLHYNPEPLVKYLKSNKEDTFVYLYEADKSSYHKTTTCPNLTSPFHSPKVPEMVRTGGDSKNEVIRFRKWYIQNNRIPKEFWEPFYKTDSVQEQKLQEEIAVMDSKHATNSGVKEIKNYSLQELYQKIQFVIEETSKYYQSCSLLEKAALNQYKCNSQAGYLDKYLNDNRTGMSDEELKTFLRDYHETFKEPLFQDLIEYYRVRFNPKLEFSGTLLEQLNFKACFNCHKIRPAF
jgi:hypothetical protein